MSGYDDDRRRRRYARDRSADDYDRQTSYKSSRDYDKKSLVRRDDSVSSVEEVHRDFPPGDKGYYRETTVRKKGRGQMRDDRYDDRHSHSDREYVSKKGSSRSYDDSRSDRRDRDRRSRKYESESSSSRSPPPKKDKDRRKSTTEELIASLGLGGLVGGILGNKDKKDGDSRGRGRSVDSGGRSRSRGPGKRDKSVGREQIIQALKAAGLAAAGEAFRARKDPGGWGGEKGKRIMTAAISAAGVDGLISNNRDPKSHGTRDVIGSALAGLATNRIVNGPRSASRGGSPDGRGRSESHGGAGLGGLAAGGVLAATAKKAYDNMRSRSKSRGRDRSRSLSESSYDSRSPPPQRRRSVSAYGARALNALGLKDQANKLDPDRARDARRYDDRYSDDRGAPGGPPGGPPGGGYGYQDTRDVSSVPRAGPDSMAVTGPHHYSLDYKPHHTGDPDTDSDSDLGSSSGEEKEVKKGQRRQLISAGLATVATIHAGHSVYQAKKKRDANKQALQDGDITAEEAKRSRTKQRWAEAGAIGIAALGLKGAYSEWKEMREQRHEFHEEKEKRERHAEKREARRRKYEDELEQYRRNGYQGPMPTMTYANGQQPYHQPYQQPYQQPGAPYNPHYAASQPQLSATHVAPPDTHYYDGNPYGAVDNPPSFHPQDFPPPPGAAAQHQAPPPPQQNPYPPPPPGVPYYPQ